MADKHKAVRCECGCRNPECKWWGVEGMEISCYDDCNIFTGAEATRVANALNLQDRWEKVAEGLKKLQAQFTMYAGEHRRKGAFDKAAVNQSFANLCADMLKLGEPSAD